MRSYAAVLGSWAPGWVPGVPEEQREAHPAGREGAVPSPKRVISTILHWRCIRFSRPVLSIFWFRILSVFLSQTGSIFSNMPRIQTQKARILKLGPSFLITGSLDAREFTDVQVLQVLQVSTALGCVVVLAHEKCVWFLPMHIFCIFAYVAYHGSRISWHFERIIVHSRLHLHFLHSRGNCISAAYAFSALCNIPRGMHSLEDPVHLSKRGRERGQVGGRGRRGGRKRKERERL